MEILQTSYRTHSPLLRNVVIPASLLVAILLFDHFFLVGATITPVCNFLAMGVLALYLYPRPMIFWACCFAASSLFMLNRPQFSQKGPFDMKLTAETRSVGAISGAMVAILLCANRSKASKSHAQLVALVKRLPVPFVLSDKNGTLLYISQEAAKLMQISQKEAEGQSYFSLLFNLSEKGAAIHRYVGLLDSRHDGESTVELRLQNAPEVPYRGTLMPVDMHIGRCLVTVITPLQKITAS